MSWNADLEPTGKPHAGATVPRRQALVKSSARGRSHPELTESLAHSWLGIANGFYTAHSLPSAPVAAKGVEWEGGNTNRQASPIPGADAHEYRWGIRSSTRHLCSCAPHLMPSFPVPATAKRTPNGGPGWTCPCPSYDGHTSEIHYKAHKRHEGAPGRCRGWRRGSGRLSVE